MITPNQLQPDHPAAPQSTTLAFGRLLGLAQHLENPDERHHNKFDFCVVAQWAGEPGCGTIGCAVGELPYCFPETFQFNGSGMIQSSHKDQIVFRTAVDRAAYLKPVSDEDAPVDEVLRAGIFFGLTMEETSHLFVPRSQDPKLFGGKHLDLEATALQVAKNIRAFLRKTYPDQYDALRHNTEAAPRLANDTAGTPA